LEKGAEATKGQGSDFSVCGINLDLNRMGHVDRAFRKAAKRGSSAESRRKKMIGRGGPKAGSDTEESKSCRKRVCNRTGGSLELKVEGGNKTAGGTGQGLQSKTGRCLQVWGCGKRRPSTDELQVRSTNAYAPSGKGEGRQSGVKSDTASRLRP